MPGLKTCRNNGQGNRGVQARPVPNTHGCATRMRHRSTDPCQRQVWLRECVMRGVVRVLGRGRGFFMRTNGCGRQRI